MARTAPESAGAVLVAAGRGRRMGGVTKALLPLAGRTLLEWALDGVAGALPIGHVVVAAPAEDLDRVRHMLAGRAKVTAVVPGGKERQDSVAAALEALDTGEWVVVHDAARPLVTSSLVIRVLDAAVETGAATAAVPARDTLKVVEDGRVTRTVDRESVWMVQTPQAFRRDLLVEAHRQGGMRSAHTTDDAALVEAMGVQVRVVEGETQNLKVTVPQDLEMAEALLRRRDHRGDHPEDRRVGIGYDAHRLVPGRPLVLGGVTIPSPRGLAGHSDGDAVVHAIMDAMLGGAGLPDIGHHFPPEDPRLRDADSLDLLRRVRVLVRDTGFAAVHLDVVVLAEGPRLAPYLEGMRAAIAHALGLDPRNIGLKATTTEGLGAIGRGEGMAAQAVATLRRLPVDRAGEPTQAGGSHAP